MWMQWDQQIIDAIDGHKTLSFRYHGEARLVEPHTFGQDSQGHKSLSAFQINKGWRLFHLAEIQGLQTGEAFPGSRPGYTRLDSRMQRIYAEL